MWFGALACRLPGMGQAGESAPAHLTHFGQEAIMETTLILTALVVIGIAYRLLSFNRWASDHEDFMWA